MVLTRAKLKSRSATVPSPVSSSSLPPPAPPKSASTYKRVAIARNSTSSKNNSRPLATVLSTHTPLKNIELNHESPSDTEANYTSPSPSHFAKRSSRRRQKNKQRTFKHVGMLVAAYLNETDSEQWSYKDLIHTKDLKYVSGSYVRKHFMDLLEKGIKDGQFNKRGILFAKRLLKAPSVTKPFAIPVAAFNFDINIGKVDANNSPIDTSTHAIPNSSQSPAQSESPSSISFSASSSPIRLFKDIYRGLRTKFPLNTNKRETTLEDLVYKYLEREADEVRGDVLLQAGFIDLAVARKIISSKELSVIRSTLAPENSHHVAACVKQCFRDCNSLKGFFLARNNFSCELCESEVLLPLFEQATSAVLYTVQFLRTTSLVAQLLEGNFDMIWSHVIDRAFMSSQGVLYRKEKGSPHTTSKFDGLYIGGNIEPQEWLIIEVARISGQGQKQTTDRQKVIEHCLHVLNYRRAYLSTRTNLSEEILAEWARKFPIWGFLCQGFSIEIIKLGWFTQSVGLVTNFVAKYPDHLENLDGLYRILEEVHRAVESVRNSVVAWNDLHAQMKGNW